MNVYLYWFDRVLSAVLTVLVLFVPVVFVWGVVAPVSAQKYVPGVSLIVKALDGLRQGNVVLGEPDNETLSLLNEPEKHLSAWGYEGESASGEDILSSAIRDGEIRVARAAIFTNEPLSGKLLFRVVIPKELKNDLVEHGNWSEAGGICAHLAAEKALFSNFPVKDENIALLADICPAEKWQLRRKVDAIMKEVEQVQADNRLADEKLGIARQDCYRFFFSPGFRQDLEKAMALYFHSDGRETEDVPVYSIRLDLQPFVRSSEEDAAALNWLRSDIDFGNIAAVGDQLVAGPRLKATMSPVEERLQQSIDELARSECYALRAKHTPEPRLAQRAKNIRPFLE